MQGATFVRAFYADWDPDSRERCLEVERELGGERVELREIGSHADEWAATGMRTIPAFEVFVEGRPVKMTSGAVEADSLREALGSAAASEARLGRIEPLEVVSSTGSYRYDRWGEHFVTAYSRPEEGWSSPTRRAGGAPAEELVFDALAPHRVVRIGMTPRPWDRDPAYRTRFPSAFEVGASMDGADWQSALSVEEFRCAAPTTQYWDVDVEARYLRLAVTDVPPQGKPGRYMCQVMKFEAWGEPLAWGDGPRLASGRWDRVAGDWDTSVTKLGLRFAPDPSTAAVWHLAPGARMPARRRPAGGGKLLGLEGRAAVEDTVRGEVVELERGTWVAYGPEATIVVSNRSDDQPAAVLELAGYDGRGEVWAG